MVMATALIMIMFLGMFVVGWFCCYVMDYVFGITRGLNEATDRELYCGGCLYRGLGPNGTKCRRCATQASINTPDSDSQGIQRWEDAG